MSPRKEREETTPPRFLSSSQELSRPGIISYHVISKWTQDLPAPKERKDICHVTYEQGGLSPSARGKRGGRRNKKTPTHRAPSSHDGERARPHGPSSTVCHHHTDATILAKKTHCTYGPGYVSRTWEIGWEAKKKKGGEAGHPRRAREGGARGWFITIAALTIKEGWESEGGKTEVVKGGWVFMAHPPIPSRAPSLATVISFLFWYSA